MSGDGRKSRSDDGEGRRNLRLGRLRGGRHAGQRRHEAAEASHDIPRDVLLACRNLSVSYDYVQVLFGVDLDVREGEIVALLGSNGAGKTTLLKGISGVLAPVAGSVFLAGEDVTRVGPAGMAQRGVFQAPAGKDGIFPTLTTGENLRAAAWLFGEDEERIAAAIAGVRDQFPRLAERFGLMAGNLSGGEQQMLTLAMAMLAEPKLLMFDELSLGLAPVLILRLLDMLRAIRDQGTTVILVEQSVMTALDVADRAYFMEKGEIRASGSAQELLEQEDVVRSQFLREHDRGKNRSSSGHRAAKDRSQTPVAAVEGIIKRFGGITALNEVSFELHEHEILGIIGPNGAGKTTLFDVMSGFEPSNGGKILLEGTDITEWSPDQRASVGLGRSFQDSRIFPSLTVIENLAVSLERHLPVRDHLASFLRLPEAMDLEDDITWTVSDLLELMNLGSVANKPAAELSTGTRRTVDLAMALGHEPRVLLLDEPSSGIAQRETAALGELLLRVQRELGCALIVIEHDMSLITSISDRMLALDLGQLIAEGTPREVTNDPRVIESYLGGSSTADVAPRPAAKRRRPVAARQSAK